MPFLDQNMDWRKMCLVPDEISHGLGTQRENHAKEGPIIYFFSDKDLLFIFFPTILG